MGGGHDMLGHVRNISNFNENLSSIVLTVVPPYSEASQEVHFPVANGGNAVVSHFHFVSFMFKHG